MIILKRLFLFNTLFVITICTCLGQTQLDGTINTNVTLRKESSPYVIQNSLVVATDGRLTIDPGVEVRFGAGATLEVRGHIVARGTKTDSIRFTAAGLMEKGSWGGVIINNALEATGDFNHCSFAYASTALAQTCCGDVGTIWVRNSSFRNNIYGLTGHSRKYALVDSCSFTYNTNAVAAGYANINASMFNHNDYGLFETGGVNVSNSVFNNHSEAAIMGSAGTLEHVTLENNNYGVKASHYEGFTIRHSNISNNRIGVELANSWQGYIAPIDSSKICNNSEYNIVNPTNIDAKLFTNCWCSSDSTVIENKILDGWDESARGLVDYSVFINLMTVKPHYYTVKAEGRIAYYNVVTKIDHEASSLQFYPNPAIETFCECP